MPRALWVALLMFSPASLGHLTRGLLPVRNHGLGGEGTVKTEG